LVDRFPGGVVEWPIDVTLARLDRTGGTTALVTITSASSAVSSVRSFGLSRLGSRPRSERIATTAGLRSAAGSDPADRTSMRPLA
jgi:hypothetical protein